MNRLFLLAFLVAGCGSPAATTMMSGPADMSACAAPLSTCAGSCVDTRADAKNCGACGVACGPSETCGAGVCTLVCGGGSTACGGADGGAPVCVNLQTDLANCGACGMACPMGQGCAAGKCALTCAPGLLTCGGACVNPMSDVANCGMCGTACPMGQVCSAGMCALTCGMGLANCSGACVNPMGDPQNCGMCGMACPMGNVCSAGMCAVSCQRGLDDCGGMCANLMTDNANCGMCGTACPMGTVCSGGMCGLTCQMGLSICNGVCVNPMSDVANCGMCGTACPMGNVCSAGMCAVSCQMGLSDCGGVCANLMTDNANCGMCGTACPMGSACAGGTCVITCQMGLMNCNKVCVNPMTDAQNCGNCGVACPMGQVCVAGKCAANCGNNQVACNGACVDTRFDPANCGGCAKACNVANGMGACFNSACVVGACNMGFGDCDRDAKNGCEITLAIDSGNCGACGKACPPGQLCQNSACVLLGSCKAILATFPQAPSGVYTIDDDAAGPDAAFQAYCEMVADGGGWTLAIKMNGNNTTFNYDQAIWTSKTLLNANSPGLDMTEAKLQTYNGIPYTALRLGMIDPGDNKQRWLVVPTGAQSLFAAIAPGVNVTTNVGRVAWETLLLSPSLQPNCNDEGIDSAPAGGGWPRVRIGIASNQENDCNSPDSWIGFGGQGATCFGNAAFSCGDVAGCSADNGNRSTATFGYVMIR